MSSLEKVIWGPIFIGTTFNVVLYGVMIMQTFLYFTVYTEDKLRMKIFVMILFLCDSLNCAYDVALVYIPLIRHHGNQRALAFASWLSAADPAMTGIIALFVQLFFAWRIKVLTKSWPLVLLIVFCSVCQWCGGLGSGIAITIVPAYMQFQRFQVVVIIWLVFSALTDTIITITLVWHLQKHKTGFASTDAAITRLMRLTVQTGMVTAICAIVDLICFLATPTALHVVFNLPLPKLYTNSLMASLNSRAGWGYGRSLDETSEDIQLHVPHTRATSLGENQQWSQRSSEQKSFIERIELTLQNRSSSSTRPSLPRDILDN
ncbi:hypothetical protein BDW22DRAFT_1423313 [Trametopsis cervina]|nr:hypothetical protein BDW22DRAFT_1423313 [Trametopsis cervina]